MRVTAATARRLSTAAVGIVGALTFTACSSSSSGKPIPVSTAAGSSVSSTASSSANSSATSSSSVGTGGANSALCKELRGADLSHIGVQGGASGIAEIVKEWDRIAAAAPPEIKKQVGEIDQYMHTVAAGNPDASKAAELVSDVQAVMTWIQTNCA